jgi:hypothetical protein
LQHLRGLNFVHLSSTTTTSSIFTGYPTSKHHASSYSYIKLCFSLAHHSLMHFLPVQYPSSSFLARLLIFHPSLPYFQSYVMLSSLTQIFFHTIQVFLSLAPLGPFSPSPHLNIFWILLIGSISYLSFPPSFHSPTLGDSTHTSDRFPFTSSLSPRTTSWFTTWFLLTSFS